MPKSGAKGPTRRTLRLRPILEALQTHAPDQIQHEVKQALEGHAADPKASRLNRTADRLFDRISSKTDEESALRLTVAKLVSPFEKENGTIDLEVARAVYGEAFEDMLWGLREAPASEPLIEGDVLALGDAAEVGHVSTQSSPAESLLAPIAAPKWDSPTPALLERLAHSAITHQLWHEGLMRDDMFWLAELVPPQTARQLRAEMEKLKRPNSFATDWCRAAVLNWFARGKRSPKEVERVIAAIDSLPRNSSMGLAETNDEALDGLSWATTPEAQQLLFEAVVGAVDRMPVVTRAAKQISHPGSRDLMVRAHMLGSTIGLMCALKRPRMQPFLAERPPGAATVLLGKDYSLSHRVKSRLYVPGWRLFVPPNGDERPGIPRSEEKHDSLFDPSLSRVTQNVVRILGDDAKQPFQMDVIDDGADLLLDLALNHKDQAAGIRGVEITRFGARRLHQVDLPFPVINIAESLLKLLLESVLIGWSVVAEMQQVLKGLEEDGIKTGQQTMVIGYGAVGRATARVIASAGFDVRIVDSDPERIQLAIADGFGEAACSLKPDPFLDSTDLVVGATGYTSLRPKDFKRLKNGAILFSATSSTIEFAAQGSRLHGSKLKLPGNALMRFRGRAIRPLSPSVPDDVPNQAAHRHQLLRQGGKEWLVANAAAPVNFTGEIDPIAPELIQLTRGLLVNALAQLDELPEGTTGLIELDVDRQVQLANEWMAEVRQLGDRIPRAVLQLLEEGYEEALSKLGSSGERTKPV